METLDEGQTALGPQPNAVWRDYELVVASGPSAGARVRVDATTPRRLVGQSRACHLVVDDREASRRHIAIESTPRGLLVTDLDSTNGTSLNGVVIVSAYAKEGDRIRLGRTELLVERVETRSAAPPLRDRFGRIVGASEVMQRLYPIFEKLVVERRPVLIEGPSGSGKELLAETLHEKGPRKDGPFVVCETTGRVGSITAARLAGAGDQRGLFAQADGGTLFIEEIGDLDAEAQAWLLRAIAPGAAGASSNADVRVIGATRRDLETAVQLRRFREDLYFELAPLRVELPALRERRGDVARLALHFWSTLGGSGRLDDARLAFLTARDWPGNVSELRSAIARLVALGDALPSEPETEPEAATAPIPSAPTTTASAERADPFEPFLAENLTLPVARQRVVDAFEKRYVARALAAANGNATAAAAASGIARRYFYTVKKRSS